MMMFRFFPLFILFMALPALTAAPEVSAYKLETRVNGGMTLRLKLNKMLDFQSFTLDKPDRVVIDLAGAKWQVPKAEKPQDNAGFVKKLRTGIPKPETLRVVLDVTQPVKIEDAFVQVPGQKGGAHYLIVQMKLLKEEKKSIAKPEPAPLKTKKEVAVMPVVPPAFIPIPKFRPERFIIVLDPGHGGVDPGAIGAQGTKEKEITLRYAEHLRELLNASARYEVVMTRTDDTYVPLRGRVEKSQKAGAQLFISLHADSHPEPNMRGLSVYTLSENASDKEAEALAERENKKDIITGVDLSKQSRDVAEVLIDLAQRDTKNTSARFAELVVAELGTEAKLLKNTHRFAGFAVLKAVGTPSALVEMGYLSNPKEEAKLISKEYQDKLVHAIARAVDTYCDRYAPREDSQ